MRHNNITMTWKLPARTVKAWGSTMTLPEGCNRCWADLLRDIYRAQKGYEIRGLRVRIMPGMSNPGGGHPQLDFGKWRPKKEYPEASIEITATADGKTLSVNGNYKPGTIKRFMANYCRPGEGKIRLVKVK